MRVRKIYMASKDNKNLSQCYVIGQRIFENKIDEYKKREYT